jgi:hypothetical protein
LNIPGLVSPGGLVTDPAGQLWVLDSSNLTQLTIYPLNGESLYTVPLAASSLSNPASMSFTAGARSLLIADIGNGTSNELVLVNGTQAALNYPQTAVGAQSAAQAAAIASIGNSTLKPTTTGDLYSLTGNTQDFQVSSTSSCLSFTQLLPTQSCAFSAIFAPTSAGTESETIASLFNSAVQVQLLLSGVAPSSASVVASPAFSLGSGTYSTPQMIRLTDATPKAVIYYTTDGTTPNTSSPDYHGAVSVSTTQTMKAIAVASGFTKSPVASATYSFPSTAEPVIAPGSGAYAMPMTATIVDLSRGAKILWCTVTSGSCKPATPYTGSISIDPATTETICANATDSGHAPSATTCHVYTNHK